MPLRFRSLAMCLLLSSLLAACDDDTPLPPDAAAVLDATTDVPIADAGTPGLAVHASVARRGRWKERDVRLRIESPCFFGVVHAEHEIVPPPNSIQALTTVRPGTASET